MMQYDTNIFEGRLHPLTILFAVIQSARRLIIPSIPLIFFGSRLGSILLLALIFALVLARALIRYFTFGYRIEGSELITRQGLLERTERHISLERVQEIKIEQGVLHRIFGVVDASVETASGKGPEASLSVLSRAEAERLRAEVFSRARIIAAGAGPDRPEAQMLPEREVVRRLGLNDLALAGLTSNHLLSALIFIGTLWAFVDDILPATFYERIVGRLYEEARLVWQQGAVAALLIAAITALLALVLSMLFSVIGSVVLFYGFTLTRSGEALQRTYGLLTRRSSSLPRRRIQVLEIREGLLRRIFSLAVLRVDTAGGHSEEDQENKQGRDVLVPIIPLKDLGDLLGIIFPDLEPGEAIWARVSRLAILRGTIKGAILCLLATLFSSLYYGSLLGLWTLALLPLFYLASFARYRNLAYSLGDRYFHTRRGWLGRSTHIMPIRNLQAVVVRQSPLDKRLGLATLLVDSAGQTYTGGGPQISNLPIEEALSLAGRLAHRAAVMRYRLK